MTIGPVRVRRLTAMPDVRLVTAAVLPVPDPDLGRLEDAL